MVLCFGNLARHDAVEKALEGILTISTVFMSLVVVLMSLMRQSPDFVGKHFPKIIDGSAQPGS